MKLIDRMNALDDRAAGRGWIYKRGAQRPIGGQVLEELGSTPPGWIALSVIAMVLFALVSPALAKIVDPVAIGIWVMFASRRVSRRFNPPPPNGPSAEEK